MPRPVSDCWNALAVPWKLPVIDSGSSDDARALHFAHRLSDGDAGPQIEGQRDRRKLARVVDGQRPEVGDELGDGAERDQFPRRRVDVELGEHGGIALVLGRYMENNLVEVGGRVDVRHLVLAIGGIKGVFHLLRGDPQRGCLVAIDDYIRLRILILQIRGDVGQVGQFCHPGLHDRRVSIQRCGIRAFQRVLILALGGPAADLDGWRDLDVRAHPRNVVQLGLVVAHEILDAHVMFEERARRVNHRSQETAGPVFRFQSVIRRAVGPFALIEVLQV